MKRGWHIEIDIVVSSMYVHMRVLNCRVQLHRTGTPIILVIPTNDQNAGDLMPSVGRREKGPKCRSFPLNAGELAALFSSGLF